MIRMTLDQAASLLQCSKPGTHAEFSGVSIDSRTLKPGELFVAFVGEQVDGHEFLEQARDRGAAGALVSRHVDSKLPLLICEDTGAALAELARDWRLGLEPQVIGITGSNGKTTVKEMTACILGPVMPTLVTRGNFNNEIGLPLTLCELGEQHRSAVIEMGAGQPGDIRYLGELARHDVAVITNAGPAHLERLGSVDNVALEKGDIIRTLPENGTAVLNADDDYIELWRDMAGDRKVIDFALESAAAVKGSYSAAAGGIQLHVEYQNQAFDVRLHAEGRHNAMNALCAAAAAFAIGLSIDQVCAGLEAFQPVKDRLNHYTTSTGAMLIKDTYNANPASVAAAIGILSACTGLRVLVLGDMYELGDEAAAFHFQTGALAKRQGIDVMMTLGDLARHANAGFGEHGRHFEDAASLIESLKSLLNDQTTCLVKGSRGMKMERVADAVLGEESVSCY